MKHRALPAGMVLCVIGCVALSLSGEPLLSFGAALAGLVLFGIGLACARPSNWPTADLDDEHSHRHD